MSQLNFYVPDDVEAKIRAAAKKQGKSISAFLADLVKSYFPEKKWDAGFFTDVAGAWSGEFPEIERPLPDNSEE